MPPLIDEALLLRCKQVHGGEELIRGVIHEKGNCFMECAMNATGTMVNGVLDQTKILQLISGSRTSSNQALTQLFLAASVVCFRSAPIQRQAHNNSNSKHCSSTAANFIGCVNMEIFKICLDEYWTSSHSCNTLRKFIHTCPVPT
ncbi:uncharacterized protein LOC131688110 [Topomyia yanbarensis]|uniref:uncharacterized protein LOC131688110 n=1 Tax=Topomyia yanbarensis TaxID=2498891 RepID=UPI00273BAE9D|nr:uncharacterized protein LOC131688110 [Topomyia yanbarensis]